MPRKGLRQKIEEFVLQNAELVADYDQTEGTYPFDYCKYDVQEKMQQLLKINKAADFKQTLSQALNNAIKYGEPITDTLSGMITKCIQDGSSGDINITQLYFNDIGEIYKKHKGKMDLEYCPENRDALIALNTKMVVSVAKKYQGLGVPLNDLISAGNEGLCAAWEKFDPEKSKIKDEIIAAAEPLPEEFTYQTLIDVLGSYFAYGKLKTKFEEGFHEGETYTKEYLMKWIDRNVFNAKFSSVCMMWIKAFILIELDTNSRLVKKPKTEIYKDKAANGAYQKETVFDLDAPIANDTDTTFADTLGMEDDTEDELHVVESYDFFKEQLNKLLEGVSNRDRTVMLLRYGIGTPRSLTPKEISDRMGLSIARVSQLTVQVMQKMRENASKYEIDPGPLFAACSNFR